MTNKLAPTDRLVLTTATELLNQRCFAEAYALLSKRILQGLSVEDRPGKFLLVSVAGLLIDIGSEGRNEQAIKEGLVLLENNRQHFDGLVTLASIEYNLGNAKSGLVEVRSPNAFAMPGLADYDLLLEAKNHYWRALKAHDRNDVFAHQLRTNLANALRKSGRITEALSTYDEILADDPTFAMASFHRGLGLLVLEHLGTARTASLLSRSLADYRQAIASTGVSTGVSELAAKTHDQIAARLRSHGYDPQKVNREAQQAQREQDEHSVYRQFTLRHHLGLSEHSLYCHCTGARRDDLMIATSGRRITGDHIPRLELILNRLKAEFGTARLLYYQATQDHTLDLHEHEITFTVSVRATPSINEAGKA